MQNLIYHFKILACFAIGACMLVAGKTQAQSILAQTTNSAGFANSSLVFAVGEVYVPPVNPTQGGSGFIGIFSSPNIVNGAEEAEIGKYFTIFPNPTPNEIHIKTDMSLAYEARLSNLQGALLQTATFDKTGKLDLSHLPTGTYLLTLQTKQGQKTFKIVKAP